MDGLFVSEQISELVGARLAWTDSIGAYGTISLPEHLRKDRMLNTRCVCAVNFHNSELPNEPFRLGCETAAIDQTFDAIFFRVPVVWPRDC